MMADQPLAKAVIDQPGIAIRGRQAMAAGAAEHQRRVAAAVKEQHRLLARSSAVSTLGQPRRDEAAAGRRWRAQVDRLDMRHVLAAEPRRQLHALIAPLRALTSVSSEGVAEASTTGNFAIWARTTAMSRA